MRSLALALLFWAGGALAQPLWEGWYVPAADGWEALRFGMDRESTASRLADAGFDTRTAREGTLRYEKRTDGEVLELVAHFLADPTTGVGGRLYRIQLSWNRLDMPRASALRRYQHLSEQLAARYEEPVHRTDDGIGALDGGRGKVMEVYQGPEMQAVLELRALRPNQFAIHLTLDSPQLHPELPGG